MLTIHYRLLEISPEIIPYIKTVGKSKAPSTKNENLDSLVFQGVLAVYKLTGVPTFFCRSRDFKS